MNCACGMWNCNGCCFDATNMYAELIKENTHYEHDFSNPCPKGNYCNDEFCEWDHSTTKSCNVCGQFGDKVSTHCPNIEVTAKQMSKIQQGKLDFFNSKWWTANE